MTTITREITIPADHRVRLDVELPPECPAGEAVVTITVQTRPKNRLRELRGKYQGQIWMSDDFDAPLEDFAEYS